MDFQFYCLHFLYSLRGTLYQRAIGWILLRLCGIQCECLVQPTEGRGTYLSALCGQWYICYSNTVGILALHKARQNSLSTCKVAAAYQLSSSRIYFLQGGNCYPLYQGYSLQISVFPRWLPHRSSILRSQRTRGHLCAGNQNFQPVE